MDNRKAKTLIRKAEREYHGINSTRWYSTVHARKNGEARVRTWAVKSFDGKPVILLASEYNTDGSTNHVSGRCIYNICMNTKSFNWFGYGGRRHQAVFEDIDSSADEWSVAEDHRFKGGHEFFGLGTFLNGWGGTKYEYFGYDRVADCIRLTDFLDCFRVSPMVEMLAKAGLHRWMTPTFVKKLVADKRLTRFVARNANAIRGIPASYVCREFSRSGDAADIREMAAIADLGPYGLAHLPFKAVRIWEWMNRNGVEPEMLRHHVDNLKELKLDLAYEPHVLPHDWASYSNRIENAVAEAREAEVARAEAIVRAARKEARKLIAKWQKEGIVRKEFKVVLPCSETELVEEGRAMSNCVGQYWTRIASGACNLVFVRKFGRPYIDIEVDGTGGVVQMRYNHNRAVNAESADGRLCLKLAEAFKEREVG